MDFQIKEELKNLIPPLTKDEFRQLEDNIFNDGIRDALVVGEYSEDGTKNRVLIDGHNRLEIAKNSDLEYKLKTIRFKSFLDIKEWMITHQFGRRNLNNYQRSSLALQLEYVYSEKAKLSQARKPLFVRQISDEQKEDVSTKKELAKIANVSHDTIARVKKLEEKATPELKEKLEKGEVSINQAYKEVRKEEKKEELQKRKEEYDVKVETKTGNEFKVDIFTTKEKFRVIYADPSWSYNDKQDTPQLGGAAKHYDNMSISQICDLPVNEISDKNSVLFLWVTSPLLEDSFKVLKAWGFKYKTSFIWDKVKHNMGHYNSVRHEILLIATKGSCTPDNKKLFDSVQSIERNDNHSEKPIEFLNIIDELYSFGDKLEMFCRKIKKQNWYGWGNEI